MMKGKHEKKRNKNFLLVLSRSKKKQSLWQIGSFPMYFSKQKRNYEPEFAKEIINKNRI